MGYKRTGRPTGRPSKHTEDDWLRAKALLEDGVSYRETAITTGIPKSTLRDNLPGYGWTPEESGTFRTFLNKSPVSKEVWGMNRRNNAY
jgi:DNA invertase Pin-like site-specific DNA recombinase